MIRTLLLLLCCLPLCSQDSVFCNLTLSELPLDQEAGLDPNAWSEPVSVDGQTCRQLLNGTKGRILIPVWWQETLRPTPGANALAAITFQDTASTPIRVNLYAGLPGEIEIHRIGGLADGQWKTALVPVPWDQIIRMKNTNMTAISLYAAKGQDVPVQQISIRKGNKQRDERRWAAETRDWVARVQADKRAHASLPEAQTAALPENKLQEPAVIFARPMTKLIYPNSAPQATDTLDKLKITLARNEMESVQFGVYAMQGELPELSIQCGQLSNADGTLFQGDIELFTVEYSAVTAKGDTHPLYPQRLWPHYAVDIAAQQSHAYWLTVESLRGKTQPGHYHGTVDILSQGKKIKTVPLELQVLPIDLMTMSEAGLHLGGCVPRLLPAHELNELARYNHNSINLWYSGTWAGNPIIKTDNGFTLDFWHWDDFMQHARDAGIENFVYFLGGNPYGYPDTMQLERDLYRFAYADDQPIDAARTEWLKKAWQADGKVVPEIRELYKHWAKTFYQHAADNNWPEPIVTPFDEPAKWAQEHWARGKQYRWLKENGSYGFGVTFNRNEEKFLKRLRDQGYEPEYLCDGAAGPWIKTHFKDCAALIHEAWPEARIYGSIHHAADGLPFLEDIEVFCTNAIHQDYKLGDKVRAAKDTTFWQYSGTNDKRPPATPWFTFGFYFGAFDSRGSLVWAYNWGNRFDTATGGGQWMYAWTTPYSLVRAPYLEGLREGFDDRRYIETLKKVAQEKDREAEATALLDSIFGEVINSRNKKGRDTVHNFFAQSEDPDKLSSYRQQITELILKLQE